MSPQRILLAGLLAIPLASFFAPYTNPPTGYAAAPADFKTCRSCHSSYDLNSGGGAVTIDGPTGGYVPGTTYAMTISMDHVGYSRWGFELVALDESGASVGTLAPVDGYTSVSTSGGIAYLAQTTSGTFSGTPDGATWNFNYTAPAAGTGKVRFYASGMAASGSGTRNDYVYTGAWSMTEASGDASVVAQPEVQNPRLGSTWTIPVTVSENSGSANQVYLVSRVDLGGGNFYPSTGWLSGPSSVTLVADGQERVVLSHAIATTTPLITASYQVLVGRPPATLVDLDSFVFTVTP